MVLITKELIRNTPPELLEVSPDQGVSPPPPHSDSVGQALLGAWGRGAFILKDG